MNLIVARAPFRLSFAGGGTDLPSFYQREKGAVVSATIDKYVYIIVNGRNHLFKEGFRFSQSSLGDIKSKTAPSAPFQFPVRVSYSKTEDVTSVEELQHPIVREALRFLDITEPLDISTMADVPAGTGLGSSSTFAVALLQALHVFKGERPTAEQLASEAARLEINILGRPVGKQDHYAAAYGGLNLFEFLSDETVNVKAIEPRRVDLAPWLALFYTGLARDATSVLSEQKARTSEKANDLRIMRDHALTLHGLFLNGFDPAVFGAILHETWIRKRTLASGITNTVIDQYYEHAIKNGALGGKICGAGGGGFLLFVVKPDRREALRKAMSDLPEMEFSFETGGGQVLLR